MIGVVAAVSYVYFLVASWGEPAVVRRRTIALVLLTGVSILFWSVYNQVGTSFLLFTARLVDRTVLGVEIPASEFLSLNPLFILLMGGPFAALWAWLARHGRNPSIPLKFALGHLLLAAAFLVLAGNIASFPDCGVPWLWLVLFFVLYTAAEMTLSPVSLAMASALAPARLRGFTMGLWLMATAVAYYVSGVAAGLAAVPAGKSAEAMAPVYRSAFVNYGLVAAGGGLIMLAATPWVVRLMSRDDAPDRTS